MAETATVELATSTRRCLRAGVAIHELGVPPGAVMRYETFRRILTYLVGGEGAMKRATKKEMIDLGMVEIRPEEIRGSGQNFAIWKGPNTVLLSKLADDVQLDQDDDVDVEGA